MRWHFEITTEIRSKILVRVCTEGTIDVVEVEHVYIVRAKCAAVGELVIKSVQRVCFETKKTSRT